MSCWAQQPNGKNYAVPTQLVGNPIQHAADGGDNGLLLTVPLVTGIGPFTSWGLFHAIETAADSAGTNHHGMALYDGAGNLRCSIYTTRTTVVGDNTYNLSGCGTPLPNSSYTIGFLTDFTGIVLGTNNGAPLSSANCPTTSSLSGFATATSFPSTLPTLSTVSSFCFSFWSTLTLAGGRNGRYYIGDAGFDHQVGGIPNGPWGANGKWYGGLNSVNTFVNFSDGLSNGVLPTTTTLNNSTHGTACTWGINNANTVIAGATSGHLNLITPVSAGGSGYGKSGGNTGHSQSGGEF